MRKYLFTLRPDEDGVLHVDAWVDVSALVNIKTHADYVAATAVMERLEVPTGELVTAASGAAFVLGSAGNIRQRMNNTSGPYMVMWEDDLDLDTHDFEDFINNMPLPQRKAWLQGAI